MTTDDLTERIARALYVEACEEEDGGLTWETEESVAEEIAGWERFAAAVLPIVEAEARKAKAEVLRGAAARARPELGRESGGHTSTYSVRQWLRELATEHETRRSDEH